jgi:phosphatidate cytidylyltransferase
MLSSGFCIIYPLLPGALLVYLTTRDLNDPDRTGAILCVGAILCATLADTFAFFGGKLFGKKKLCPQISPKKTIAGSVASFFGGALGGLIMYYIFNVMPDAVRMYDWIFIGIACGGFAQIGDLTASMLKRFCDVKDFGHYIPGHGGIMDRMDSISTCLIAIIVYFQIFMPEIL